MPELPDLTAYLVALRTRLLNRELRQVRLGTPFLLRTASPPLASTHGSRVTHLSLLGKRLVFHLDAPTSERLCLVLHLMIAGRLHWRKAGAGLAGKQQLAAFDFEEGTLLLTEAGTKRRASLHLVEGDGGLKALDPGGADPLQLTGAEFRAVLVRENHTLKRSLTDPRLFAGIGNAYSDEILHHARLSPFKQTRQLKPEEADRLHDSVRSVLQLWIERLSAEAAHSFPEKVTAFRPEMAVHGRFGQPCPDCGSPVQRIAYADNECNYCVECQTGGYLLADRSLSRLLKSDWPRTLAELEERYRPIEAQP